MTLGPRFRFGLGHDIFDPLLAKNANKPRVERKWGDTRKIITRAKLVKVTQLPAHHSPPRKRISS